MAEVGGGNRAGAATESSADPMLDCHGMLVGELTSDGQTDVWTLDWMRPGSRVPV